MLEEFPRAFKRLQARTRLNPVLIFLEASHQTLVRRFSETSTQEIGTILQELAR